jgi:hypothetical protein
MSIQHMFFVLEAVTFPTVTSAHGTAASPELKVAGSVGVFQ